MTTTKFTVILAMLFLAIFLFSCGNSNKANLSTETAKTLTPKEKFVEDISKKGGYRSSNGMNFSYNKSSDTVSYSYSYSEDFLSYTIDGSFKYDDVTKGSGKVILKPYSYSFPLDIYISKSGSTVRASVSLSSGGDDRMIYQMLLNNRVSTEKKLGDSIAYAIQDFYSYANGFSA